MDKDKDKLGEDIAKAITDVATIKEINGIKSLSRHNPQKVAKILYLYSIGVSQTQMVKKYYLDRETIISTLVDYSDYKHKFRELGGKIASRSYLNLSSLQEDLVNKLRSRIDEDPEFKIQARDIKDISIAVANSANQALTARGEATNITEDRKVYSKEDYDQTLRAARERIQRAKKAQVEEIMDVG